MFPAMGAEGFAQVQALAQMGIPLDAAGLAALGFAQAGFQAYGQAQAYGQQAFAQSPTPAGLAPQTGAVKLWWDDKGYGFIVPDDGGPDIFVHRSGLTNTQTLVANTRVTFVTVHDAQKGKIIAQNVVCESGPGQSPPMSALVAPDTAAVPSGLDATGESTGTVKAWYEDKGFGFIAPDQGSSGDVFVHRTQLLDGNMLAQGARVSFQVSYDSVKCKNIAQRVTGAVGTAAGSAGRPPPSALPATQAAGVVQSGVVKRWIAEKGFGFVAASQGGEDVFVHARDVSDGSQMYEGLQVLYEAVWDAGRNKWKALKCYSAHGQAGAGYGQQSFGMAQAQPGFGMAGPSAPSSGGYAPPPAAASDTLHFGGLPGGISEDQLRSIIAPYGSTLSLQVLPSAGRPDASAIVRMADVNMAKWLVDNVNGNMMVGLSSPVSIRFASPQELPPPTSDAGPWNGYGKTMPGAAPRPGPYGDQQQQQYQAATATQSAEQQQLQFHATALAAAEQQQQQLYQQQILGLPPPPTGFSAPPTAPAPPSNDAHALNKMLAKLQQPPAPQGQGLQQSAAAPDAPPAMDALLAQAAAAASNAVFGVDPSAATTAASAQAAAAGEPPLAQTMAVDSASAQQAASPAAATSPAAGSSGSGASPMETERGPQTDASPALGAAAAEGGSQAQSAAAVASQLPPAA